MTITLPPAYNNAPIRPADVTQTMIDLYNVVAQINAGLSPVGVINTTSPATIAVNSSSTALTVTQAGTGNAIFTDGSIGAGSLAGAGQSVLLAKNITGTTIATGLLNSGVIQSDVTSTARLYSSLGQTAASAFTLGALHHYRAEQGVFGAGSTVTDQRGFFAHSSLVGGTSNFGFFSDIPSGTNRWNFYGNGSARNFLNGNLWLGTINPGSVSLANYYTVTGGTDAFATGCNNTILSDVTNSATIYSAFPSTQATAFTLTDLYHFRASQGTIGAGSAITNQSGFRVESSLIGATNNFGFRGSIPSGTNRWNLYMDGTAANFLAGDVQLGKTVTPGGTTGAQTINKTAGTVNFAAAATSLVVTNNLVTTNSIIICTVGTVDSTMKTVVAVAGSGSFTLTANAAATAETRVNFVVFN